MTDMTTETPLAPALRDRRGTTGLEYKVYFALIFALMLPGAALGWIRDMLVRHDGAGKGPIGRALSQAHTITPQIFCA